MQARAVSCAVLLDLFTLANAPLPAMAQDGAPADALASSPDRPVGPPLSPDEAALLGQALVFDPSAYAKAPAKPLRAPRAKAKEPDRFGVSRTDTPGGSTVVVKQPLPWDAKVGADLALASDPAIDYRPTQPLAPARGGNSGAAWASVGVTDYATVDARVDPTRDQGRLAGTLRHSLPFGESYALTLQNSTSLTDSYGTPAPSAPAGLPMMALPQDATAGPSQVWGNEQTVKFDILSTGTSLAAGLATTSTDPITHNSLSARQKLLGPLHVTTSVSDLGQPTANKSITAGFKLDW